jgi:DNA polymerase iota
MEAEEDNKSTATRHWLAHPRTLRLSTRPRPPKNADGTRSRTFNRMSQSATIPNFAFNTKQSVETTAEKLVNEALIPLFRRLHTAQSNWDLSLVNIAVTDMQETARDDKNAVGRDISKMLRNQDSVLKEWKIDDIDVPPSQEQKSELSDQAEEYGETLYEACAEAPAGNTVSNILEDQDVNMDEDSWQEDPEDGYLTDFCAHCGLRIPAFAVEAHERFHLYPDPD